MINKLIFTPYERFFCSQNRNDLFFNQLFGMLIIFALLTVSFFLPIAVKILLINEKACTLKFLLINFSIFESILIVYSSF